MIWHGEDCPCTQGWGGGLLGDADLGEGAAEGLFAQDTKQARTTSAQITDKLALLM